MDQSSFSLDNYKVHLHKTAAELVIEAEDRKTEKVYTHHATNEAVQAFNLFFLSDIEDLFEILKEGLQQTNPNTKVSIGDGPALELETIMKFGKADKKNTISFKLEGQDLGAMAACERIVANLVGENLNNANPIEQQIIKVLQKLVDFSKNVEGNMLNGPKNLEQKIEEVNRKLGSAVGQDRSGSNDKVVEKIDQLEKSVRQIESRVSELEKKGSPKTEDLEAKFAEVNKKFESHGALLTNASRSISSSNENHTKVQTKVDGALAKMEELEKVIKELEAKLQGQQGSGQSSLEGIISPGQKSGAPYPIAPLQEIVHSESFVLNNYEVELFLTTKECVIQAEEIATSKIYTKTIGNHNIKGLTLNSFPNINSLYDGLATALKEPAESGVVTINEGKLTLTRPKKINLSMEKVELEPFASCERAVKRFTEKVVEPQYLLEKRLKEMFRKIFDQEKKLTNMVFETAMKFEQLEKSVEELQG